MTLIDPDKVVNGDIVLAPPKPDVAEVQRRAAELEQAAEAQVLDSVEKETSLLEKALGVEYQAEGGWWAWIRKHPGGPGHDQKTHGSWARGTDSGVEFDAKGELRKLGVPDRVEAWNGLSIREQDAQANASESIGDRIKEVTGDLPAWQDSGDLVKDMEARMDSAKHLVAEDSVDLIKTSMTALVEDMGEFVTDKGLIRQVLTEATDAMIAQDYESMGRTLGDHGARHLLQDSDYAIQMLDAMGMSTPKMRALATLTAVWHDAGYMTPPGRNFLDRGHQRWSKQFFDAHLAETMGKVFPERDGAMVKLMSATIASHDTIVMDWQNKPFSSAIRVADNMGLFHSEKYPPFMHMVPDNVGAIAKLGAVVLANGDVGAAVKTAQAEVTANIKAATHLPQQQRDRLLSAVPEINPILPKLYLGMSAGSMGGFEFRDGTMTVTLNEEPLTKGLDAVVDFGQRQFKKMAETYGVSLDDFWSKGELEYDHVGTDQVDLRVLLNRLKKAYPVRAPVPPARIRKHDGGGHDQKTHGRRGRAAGGDSRLVDNVALGMDGLTPDQAEAVEKKAASYDITQESLNEQMTALADAVLGEADMAEIRRTEAAGMLRAEVANGLDWYDDAATELLADFAERGLGDVSLQVAAAAAAALSPNLPWDQQDGAYGVNSPLAATVAQVWRANPSIPVTPEMLANKKLLKMGLKTINEPGVYKLQDMGYDAAGAVMSTFLGNLPDRDVGDLSGWPRWGEHTRQATGANYSKVFQILDAARTPGADVRKVIEDSLGGPKTRNFYNALVTRGAWEGAVIDVHMLRGMLPHDSNWPSTTDTGGASVRFPAQGGSYPRGGPKPSGTPLSGGVSGKIMRADSGTAVRRAGKPIMWRGQEVTHSPKTRLDDLPDVGVYPMFQQALRLEAQRRNMSVSDLQAIVWYFIRQGGKA